MGGRTGVFLFLTICRRFLSKQAWFPTRISSTRKMRFFGCVGRAEVKDGVVEGWHNFFSNFNFQSLCFFVPEKKRLKNKQNSRTLERPLGDINKPQQYRQQPNVILLLARFPQPKFSSSHNTLAERWRALVPGVCWYLYACHDSRDISTTLSHAKTKALFLSVLCFGTLWGKI